MGIMLSLHWFRGELCVGRTVEAKENEGSLRWKFWFKKPKALKVEEDILHPTRVVGVIRGSEDPNIFVPENDPSSGQWFYVNIPMIARSCALTENTLYIQDINEDFSATNPYPFPKDVNKLFRYSVMPQDHLNYTLTWHSLSVAVSFMAFQPIKPNKLRR
ncbi:surfeit locus protein 1-like [Zingiber officinale]|uniref:surfeit locus protein 1-like n=1 Tax=Zingiber officinale TaxID=94328 RepID=UPI001C4CA28F|nr:surfeit locus protein 1-like [Zingiber officinale]